MGRGDGTRRWPSTQVQVGFEDSQDTMLAASPLDKLSRVVTRRRRESDARVTWRADSSLACVTAAERPEIPAAFDVRHTHLIER